jgi:hypothetical protein
MKHFLNVTVIIATLVAPTPAWAQSPSVTYSFSPASAAGTQGSASRAPGADALRWLGGLGPVQAEPKPAPIPIASGDRQRRQARR